MERISFYIPIRKANFKTDKYDFGPGHKNDAHSSTEQNAIYVWNLWFRFQIGENRTLSIWNTQKEAPKQIGSERNISFW